MLFYGFGGGSRALTTCLDAMKEGWESERVCPGSNET